MHKREPHLSVIVPLAPGERHWHALAPDLLQLPEDTELILSATRPADEADQKALQVLQDQRAVRWLSGSRGRAAQLNRAAREAAGSLLFFLHADSRFCEDTLPHLAPLLQASSRTLYYHRLAYQGDGPWLMKINELGIRWRCRIFRVPFGDQGFCLSRQLFWELGGFCEHAQYGEDHRFVWKALHAGVAVQCTGGSLSTSARRYHSAGWLRTTSKHLGLTIAQGAPELCRYLFRRRGLGGT